MLSVRKLTASILHLSAGQCPAHMALTQAPCAPGTVLLKDEEFA